MDVDAYLQRIGFTEPVRRNADCLAALHRAHMLSIPYENLEIQLGRENRLGEDHFFDKLVTGRRGGWCYEMNGLFTAVLAELGFNVTRVAGGVGREVKGDWVIGNHMVGLVDLDKRYVIDVGVSDGPLAPFALREQTWNEAALSFRLERIEDGWRFTNHEFGLAQSFDFSEQPRSLDWYQPQCTMLQTDERSPFLGLAIAVRRTPTGYRALRDATYFELHDGVRTEQDLSSEAAYARHLAEILGTDLGPETSVLWDKIQQRTEAKRAAEATRSEEAAVDSEETRAPL